MQSLIVGAHLNLRNESGDHLIALAGHCRVAAERRQFFGVVEDALSALLFLPMRHRYHTKSAPKFFNCKEFLMNRSMPIFSRLATPTLAACDECTAVNVLAARGDGTTVIVTPSASAPVN